MRALTVTAVVALCAVLAGCGFEPPSRAPLTAKAWDTSFLLVQPVYRPDENAAGGPKARRRAEMNMASYAQIPASMGSVFAVEMESLPDAAEAGTIGILPDADSLAVASAEAEPASAPPAAQPLPTVTVRPPANPAVRPADAQPQTAPIAAEAEAWYDSRVVDPALRPMAASRAENLPMAGADLVARLSTVDLAPRGAALAR